MRLFCLTSFALCRILLLLCPDLILPITHGIFLHVSCFPSSSTFKMRWYRPVLLLCGDNLSLPKISDSSPSLSFACVLTTSPSSGLNNHRPLICTCICKTYNIRLFFFNLEKYRGCHVANDYYIRIMVETFF
jgi:hypothetical protein